MKIKTITCHDVYNAGASLQAFALQKYLTDLGHEVEIIDYKPEYLSRHYSLTTISNPKYKKPFINVLYIAAKLPSRLKNRLSKKKKEFDLFRSQYLKTTATKYKTSESMKNQFSDTDIFIAGSDQIWNPLFPNGHDPAFFLEFVSGSAIKISYAASFATDSLSQHDKNIMYPWLSRLDEISVRESKAIDLLRQMDLQGKHVCDPVILIDSDYWKSIAKYTHRENKYIFYYDFDSNTKAKSIVKEYAQKMRYDILSAFPSEGMIYCDDMGPLQFLGYILNAEAVITNSYHAILFSVLFHKSFYVFLRKESINARIEDILSYLNLQKNDYSLSSLGNDSYKWTEIDRRIRLLKESSENYLKKWILKVGE